MHAATSMLRLGIASLFSLAACTDGAVIGPYTGETHRFVVDAFELPASVEAARAAGTDLDGDDMVDNLLGLSFRTLATYGDDAQDHVPELIASGALRPSIEITADDFANDPTVGVAFRGHEGASARVVGGRLVDGVFRPNRIAEVDGAHTGTAALDVPAFGDADPLRLEVPTFEIELVPDGAGGYDARIFGGVRAASLLDAAHLAIVAQLENHPEDHRSMWTVVDRNVDGTISDEEMANSVLQYLLAPDVTLSIDGVMEEVVSFGFSLHATPCAQGRCIEPTAGTCFDRVRNGDETDVDCGGSCGLACAGDRACRVAEDCQSRACDAGTCAAVSCTDGVKNGLEASLDCGGSCATKCARGTVCGYDFDCASRRCTATTTTGTCQ